MADTAWPTAATAGTVSPLVAAILPAKLLFVKLPPSQHVPRPVAVAARIACSMR